MMEGKSHEPINTPHDPCIPSSYLIISVKLSFVSSLCFTRSVAFPILVLLLSPSHSLCLALSMF